MADIAFLAGATVGGTLVLWLLSWLLSKLSDDEEAAPGERALKLVAPAYALLFLFLGITADPGGYGWLTGLFYFPAALIVWALRGFQYRRELQQQDEIDTFT